MSVLTTLDDLIFEALKAGKTLRAIRLSPALMVMALADRNAMSNGLADFSAEAPTYRGHPHRDRRGHLHPRTGRIAMRPLTPSGSRQENIRGTGAAALPDIDPRIRHTLAMDIDAVVRRRAPEASPAQRMELARRCLGLEPCAPWVDGRMVYVESGT